MRSEDPLVTEIGSFGAVTRGRRSLGLIRRAVSDLRRMGYLGFDSADPAVRDRADLLFSVQERDGSWPLHVESENGGPATDAVQDGSPDAGADGAKGYSMISLQTSLPLLALAMCGYSEDGRCERAYEWLLGRRLEDGRPSSSTMR